MKFQVYTKNSAAFVGHFQKVLLAVIMIIALFESSCCGSKTVTQSQKVVSDSTQVREIRRTEYEPIPESKAQLAIPVKDIPLLPSKASFSEKNGQANVKVRVENDTIYVDAVCDSLARRIEYYEMELNRMRSEEVTRLKIEEQNNVQTMFKWCLIGILIGSVITVIITKIIKK